MIQVEKRQGKLEVVVRCDQCGQPIRTPEMGMFKYWVLPGTGEPVDQSEVFLHKNACDEQHEAEYAGPAVACWEELDRFLVELSGSLGYDVDVVERALQSARG